MSEPLTKRSVDHSDPDTFSFSFYCDQCGKAWKSPSVPFKFDGFSAIENEEARRLLWAQEHKAAFEAANLEAHLHFNHCQKCGKWVCDDCFDDSKGKYHKECYRR